jgi:hypothetical protein
MGKERKKSISRVKTLDYKEVEGALEANCQFPLAVSENQGKPIAYRRVSRYIPFKGLLCRYGKMGEKS